MFKRFMSYYKAHWRLFIIDMVAAVIMAICGVLVPVFIRHLTFRVFHIQDASEMMRQVLLTALYMLITYVVAAVCRYYVTSWGHIMGAQIEYDMRNDIFAHIEKLSFSYFDKISSGKLISRILTDLFDITELAHHGPENIILSGVKLIGAFIFLLTINVKTTAVLFIVTMLMLYFSWRVNKEMRSTFMDNRRRIADVNAVALDSISGIRTVISFNNGQVEKEKFDQNNKRFLESKKRNYFVMGKYMTVNGFLEGMMYLAVIITGAAVVARGEMAASDIVIYILYINMFMDPIKVLINFTEQFQKGYTGFLRMCEILDTKPEIRDKKDAIDISKLKGKITFENVSFAYANQNGEDGDFVLEDINLTIMPKKEIALVGPSGAGKTTFCSLIPRFYDVSKGSLKIDDVDVRDYKLDALRSNIGVVAQDVYIFNTSIRDNIAYGKPDASDEEIVKAAKNANIHDFIMSLPEGYETMCGEHGVRFSGGQKQRLSIARVFLKNPPILILDEATSALDNESEMLVQKALRSLSEDRTTFVIAHRLSTIREADEIYVLTKDGIAEKGTHQELMAQNGMYRHLYDMQFSGQES